MESSEQSLPDRIRRGDVEAMAEFIEERRPQLLAFIERKLGPALRRKLEVEDVFQEVSVDCVRALAEVDLNNRDPLNWLCQLAERRIIDAYRKFFGAQKRDADREVGLGTPGGATRDGGLINLLVASMTSPSQAFSRQQREFRLLEEIDALPPDQSEAIRLRYVEGMPTKEIAKLLGKTDGAVRVMLTRTLKQLASRLGSDTPPL
jgi:RNA polymerase sigma-70 factor (ECF subfamily)